MRAKIAHPFGAGERPHVFGFWYATRDQELGVVTSGTKQVPCRFSAWWGGGRAVPGNM